ncbi:MAG: 5'-3' exonuclease H3TH domain-containing protein [Granulosicoccus sp.]
MLYLIDASIYIFRGWKTLPHSVKDSAGRPFNAVTGFADTLANLIRLEQPRMMLCAWDNCGRNGERNRLYPPYKADRPPAPAELESQFGRCRDLAAAFAITGFSSQRVEADDIIGHFSQLATANDQAVTIISGDKDLAQFITPSDTYWDIGKQAKQSFKDLHKRFNVRPDQVADWLALAGDKSDNIPGVPGVGLSTAARLLRRWDNLDTLYTNLGGVADMKFRGAPGVARMLAEHTQQVQLARTLTGCIKEPALPDSLAKLDYKLPSQESLESALIALDFNQQEAARLAKLATQPIAGSSV